jgi:hypothetical protein
MRNIDRPLCLAVFLILAACNLTARPAASTLETAQPEPVSPAAIASDTATPELPKPTATPEPSPTPTAEPGPIERLPAGTVPGFSAIDMIDLQNGWAIGGPADDLTEHHVFRTQDGGSTWLDVTPPDVVDPATVDTLVAQGAFWDANTAWAVFQTPGVTSHSDSLAVWHTVNGGQEWTVSGSLDIAGWTRGLTVSDVFFINAKTGWVMLHQIGDGYTDQIGLFQTTDAGTSWALVVDPAVNSEIQDCVKTGILFTGPWNGWLTGDCRGERDGVFLYQTFDGGRKWVEAVLPNPPAPAGLLTSGKYACRINPPVFFTHTTHFMLGVECASKTSDETVSRLYSSRLDGGPWDVQVYPGGYLAIRGTGDGRVFRTSVSSGIAIGVDVYMYSDSAGGWEKVSALAWIGPMDFVDWNKGWMAATDGKTRQLMITLNGGKLWEVLPAKVAGGG